MNKIYGLFNKAAGFILYCAGFAVSCVLAALLWKRTVHGRENIPHHGPVILAANHLSYADPPMIGSSVPRFVHYIAKDELFHPDFFGWVLRKVNAIPVKRGESDIKTLRSLLAVLQSGGAVLIFPEGARHKAGCLGRPRPGVGFLARQSKAPVVPVFIDGSEKYKKYGKIEIVIGKKIEFENVLEMADQEISEEVMKQIAYLQDDYYKKRQSL